MNYMLLIDKDMIPSDRLIKIVIIDRAASIHNVILQSTNCI